MLVEGSVLRGLQNLEKTELIWYALPHAVWCLFLLQIVNLRNQSTTFWSILISAELPVSLLSVSCFLFSISCSFSGSSQDSYRPLCEFSLLCPSVCDPEINQTKKTRSPPPLMMYWFIDCALRKQRVCREEASGAKTHSLMTLFVLN